MSDNPKLRKNGGAGTDIGNFIRGVKKKVLPSVLNAVGVGNFAEAIGIISNDSDNAGLSKEEADQFFKLVELEYKDVANARDTYKETDHKVADFVAKKVINYNLWVVIAAILVEVLAVVYIDDKVLIAIISGAVGGLVTALLQERQQIINFFFGSSMGSKNKQVLLKNK
tara:strand:+ start:74 stop:580 length:507 start_codon:yes stop_codon:yes gene_type:complete